MVQITQPWWDFVKAINTPEAWRVLRRNNGGWINFASNPEWPPGETVPEAPDPFPKVEGITSIENYHIWLERKSGSARIQTFLLSDAPPDPAVTNPQTRRELFCHFTSISSTGRVGNAPNGVVSYFPLLAKDEAWISDEKLEYVDSLPEEQMGTYSDLKNQGMVNFFYSAFDVPETQQDEAWPVIERAGLESIAVPRENRQEIYEGPPVGEMTLIYEEKVLLRDQVILAGYSEPPIAPPSGEGIDVSQVVQILSNAKETGIATVDSIQTALDILS